MSKANQMRAASDAIPAPDLAGLEARQDARRIAADIMQGDVDAGPKTYDDTVRWPRWKTGVLTISVCLGFWISVAAVFMYIQG